MKNRLLEERKKTTEERCFHRGMTQSVGGSVKSPVVLHQLVKKHLQQIDRRSSPLLLSHRHGSSSGSGSGLSGEPAHVNNELSRTLISSVGKRQQLIKSMLSASFSIFFPFPPTFSPLGYNLGY